MTNLEKAFSQYNAEFLSTLPDIFPEPCFSQAHKEFIEKTRQDLKKGKFTGKNRRRITVLLVAAVLVAALSLSTGGVTYQKPYRFRVYSDHYEYIVDNPARVIVRGLSYENIPEGYELKDACESKAGYDYYFQNSEGKEISIRKGSLRGGGSSYDNHYKISEVVCDGLTYAVLTKDGDCIIAWNYNDYFYDVGGTASYEELFEIAKTVK